MPDLIRRRELPAQRLAAPLSTVDALTRTVDLVFSTGATVRRRRYAGWDKAIPFDETLVVSERAVDMTRLDAGAPVLDSHAMGSTRAQVAVVDKAWIDGKEARARVRFPSPGADEAADRMFKLVSEGIVRNVSVGYSIDEIRVVEAQKRGDVEQVYVERWTPFEISFVTVPADAGAQVRSDEAGETRLYPALIRRELQAQPAAHKEPAMDAIQTAADADAARIASVQPDFSAAVAEATASERRRVADIMDLARRSGMTDAMRDAAINGAQSVEQFRVAALDHLVATRNAAATVTSSSVEVTDPGISPAQIRDAMANGIVLRATGELPKDADAGQARHYAGHSLLELGAELYGVKGRLRGVALYDAVQSRASGHATSDFPLLLAAAANKTLLQRYAYQASTFRQLARKKNFTDFKPQKFLRIGDFPLLDKLPEGGEIQMGTMSEGQEQISAATYAKRISLSRQLLVNDDLGAFSDLTAAAGARVADFENSLAWTMILANGPLADGKALFHADHGNMAGAASAITTAALSLARAAMRKQKSVDGAPLNLKPAKLVVGPDKETEALTILSSDLLATQVSNINIFKNAFDLVIDAYVTGNQWYLFADPAAAPVYVWGYVEGFDGPRFAVDAPFNIDGIQFKVIEDFGFGAVDYRGAYKNAGA